MKDIFVFIFLYFEKKIFYNLQKRKIYKFFLFAQYFTLSAAWSQKNISKTNLLLTHISMYIPELKYFIFLTQISLLWMSQNPGLKIWKYQSPNFFKTKFIYQNRIIWSKYFISLIRKCEYDCVVVPCHFEFYILKCKKFKM